MPTQNRDIKARRKAAAAGFGRMCKKWRELQGFSQYVGENWSRQAGFDVLTHGGLSPLEAGKVNHPRWGLFTHFAEMNRRLEAKDYTGIKTQDLKLRIADAQPMRDDDGLLLQEEELCGIHMGIRRIPLAYWVPEPVDAPSIITSDAEKLCSGWRADVAGEARLRGVGLVRALGELGQLAPLDERELFQDVLAGVRTYDPEQLTGLWDGRVWRPSAWIEAWRNGPNALAAVPGQEGRRPLNSLSASPEGLTASAESEIEGGGVGVLTKLPAWLEQLH